jgi:hypothetical protein
MTTLAPESSIGNRKSAMIEGGSSAGSAAAPHAFLTNQNQKNPRREKTLAVATTAHEPLITDHCLTRISAPDLISIHLMSSMA